MKNSFFKKSGETEEYWVSVSDMMAGLMMVFLLIAIIYMIDVQDKTSSIERVKRQICSELREEFAKDKERWNMTICEGGLVVAFQNDAVFKKGSSNLTPRFKKILDNFFPKFMRIVINNKSKIRELRIEGHTSSEFTKKSKNQSYVLNTRLSQARSFSVMRYVFKTTGSTEKNWMNGNLTAHGLSSSKLLFKNKRNGLQVEDREKSRRVEFRIQTNAEANLIDNLRLKIQEINPAGQSDLSEGYVEIPQNDGPKLPTITPPLKEPELPPLTEPELPPLTEPVIQENTVEQEMQQDKDNGDDDSWFGKKPDFVPSKPGFFGN